MWLNNLVNEDGINTIKMTKIGLMVYRIILTFAFRIRESVPHLFRRKLSVIDNTEMMYLE